LFSTVNVKHANKSITYFDIYLNDNKTVLSI